MAAIMGIGARLVHRSVLDRILHSRRRSCHCCTRRQRHNQAAVKTSRTRARGVGSARPISRIAAGSYTSACLCYRPSH
jgi:hypothetical protein